MEILSIITVTAKKKHRCNFCCGEISIGERYQKQAIKGDGFYMWKSHLRCVKICNELNMFDYCDEGVTHDDFVETINVNYFELIGEDNEDVKRDFYKRLDFVCEHYNLK